MTKIFEDANDQHVRNVVVYGKTSDHKIYSDSEMKTQVAQTDIEEAFAKGMLLVKEGDTYLVPVGISANKITTVATGTTATTVEWTAKATA